MDFWFQWLLDLSLRNYGFFKADILLATRAQKTNPPWVFHDTCIWEMGEVIRLLVRFCPGQNDTDPWLFTKLPVYLGGVVVVYLLFKIFFWAQKPRFHSLALIPDTEHYI